MSKKYGVILKSAIFHIYLGVYLAVCLTPSLAYADNTTTVEVSPLENQIQKNLESAVNEVSAKRLDSATAFAKKALADTQKIKGTWNYGNFSRLAHTVLNLVDALQGKMPAAHPALDMPAKTPGGSSQASNTAASLSLAKALLSANPAGAQANKKAVKEYLDNLAKTSNDPNILSKIPLWKSQIDQGSVPDFTLNTSLNLNPFGSNSNSNRCDSVSYYSVDCNGTHYVRDMSQFSTLPTAAQNIVGQIPDSPTAQGQNGSPADSGN